MRCLVWQEFLLCSKIGMNSIRETSLVTWCTLHFSLGGKAEFSCHPDLDPQAGVGPALCVVLNSGAFKVQDLEGDVFVLVVLLFSLVPESCFAFPHLSLKFWVDICETISAWFYT